MSAFEEALIHMKDGGKVEYPSTKKTYYIVGKYFYYMPTKDIEKGNLVISFHARQLLSNEWKLL